jgi:phage terminase large subunit GpA-like protein
VLTAAEAAEPGPWRNGRTPYLAGIMDAVDEAGVEEIVFIKSTQVGGSEAIRNIVGKTVDNDPGPMLYVLPSEQACKEAVEERLRPLIESTAVLRSHLTGDDPITQRKLTFDTMSIYLGWAGSPQSLASRPCRYVMLDEIDKYPSFAGREADPVSLAEERTATFGHRRRIIKVSTPTTRQGAIWKAYEACGERRHFEVPCPHCRRYQRLTFGQLKWPSMEEIGVTDKAAQADAVKTRNLAYYECEGCGGKIVDHHKPKALEAGRWVSAGARSPRVGFHISAMYSPWWRFSEVAAKWIGADGDPGRTMNFRNSVLGEPFEVQVSSTQPSRVRDRASKGLEPMVVPGFAVLLLATADVQQDRIYYVVRAWGYDWRSALVSQGVVQNFEQLHVEVFGRPFVCEGTSHAVAPERLVIDNGFRKTEVDAFAMREPSRINTAKGSSHYFGPIADAKVEKATGLLVFNINTMQSKDKLADLLNDQDETRWAVHSKASDDYCTQVVAEHKVLNPQTRQMEWKQKTSGAPNHYLDCEAMQCAVAAYRGAGTPIPVERPPSSRAGTAAPTDHPLNYRRL